MNMQWFIDHPKFNSNPFYIGGGSYSGITTGPLVQKVYEGNYTTMSINLIIEPKCGPMNL